MKPKIVNVKFDVPEIHLLNQAVKFYYFQKQPEDCGVLLSACRKIRSVIYSGKQKEGDSL